MHFFYPSFPLSSSGGSGLVVFFGVFLLMSYMYLPLYYHLFLTYLRTSRVVFEASIQFRNIMQISFLFPNSLRTGQTVLVLVRGTLELAEDSLKEWTRKRHITLHYPGKLSSNIITLPVT